MWFKRRSPDERSAPVYMVPLTPLGEIISAWKQFKKEQEFLTETALIDFLDWLEAKSNSEESIWKF